MIADAEVDRILVDGGRAVGVRLSDGEEIEARRLVASTVSAEQTFLEFLDESVVGADLAHKVRHEIAHKDWSLFSVHLAMGALPHYEAAAFNPDVDRAWVVNLGVDSTDHFDTDWKTIRAGGLVSPQPNAAVNTLYDPTDAPEGVPPACCASSPPTTWPKAVPPAGTASAAPTGTAASRPGGATPPTSPTRSSWTGRCSPPSTSPASSPTWSRETG